jgi:hypothetical protein
MVALYELAYAAVQPTVGERDLADNSRTLIMTVCREPDE